MALVEAKDGLGISRSRHSWKSCETWVQNDYDFQFVGWKFVKISNSASDFLWGFLGSFRSCSNSAFGKARSCCARRCTWADATRGGISSAHRRKANGDYLTLLFGLCVIYVWCQLWCLCLVHAFTCSYYCFCCKRLSSTDLNRKSHSNYARKPETQILTALMCFVLGMVHVFMDCRTKRDLPKG